MRKNASYLSNPAIQVRKPRKYTWDNIKKNTIRNWPLLVMVLPALAFYILFHYIPMGGLWMAFENFKPKLGIFGSPFVGLDNFMDFFNSAYAWRTIRNTLILSGLQIGIEFPITIIFALLLNELRMQGFKKFTQTASYLPHFLSWIIVTSLVADMLASDGMVNQLLMGIGLTKSPILFLGDEKYFWWVATFANVWKETGWNSIIYIAAITGIDPTMYEAAELDGAGRFKKMWHVTIPGIKSTIVVLLIMNLGWVLNTSFEVPYLLGTGMLQDVSQTIDIFVLKYGMSIGNYSLATAAGIFKSVISLILVFGTNAFANRLGESSLM